MQSVFILKQQRDHNYWGRFFCLFLLNTSIYSVVTLVIVNVATQLTQDSESSNHLCHRKVPTLFISSAQNLFATYLCLTFLGGFCLKGLSRSALGAPGRGSTRVDHTLIIWSRQTASGSSMWTVRSSSAFWDTGRRLYSKIIVISMVTATKITQKSDVIIRIFVSFKRQKPRQ